MVAAYYLEDDRLILTPCCMLGNQPKIIAEPGDETSTATFNFSGGSNLQSDNDPYMYDAIFKFVNNDHVPSTRILHKDSKQAEKARMDIRHKKT